MERLSCRDLARLMRQMRLDSKSEVQNLLKSAEDFLSKAANKITTDRSTLDLDSESYVKFINCIRVLKRDIRSLKHGLEENAIQNFRNEGSASSSDDDATSGRESKGGEQEGWQNCQP